jgi:hypothetical protein
MCICVHLSCICCTQIYSTTDNLIKEPYPPIYEPSNETGKKTSSKRVGCTERCAESIRAAALHSRAYTNMEQSYVQPALTSDVQNRCLYL